HRDLALLDLARFLASALAAAALALFLAWLADAAGWDPRGTVFGTYVQRNALVVGVAMGFAVIPLIYTISEDALVSVPDHLRAASLGAGASKWQTAVRVVIPPAMSGLFSAAMIGLGRAVGETMIVLMAAGNTPIMEINLFNGFRTLSANLAVELPEAVQNSTHYRTLFLAALVLFAMTFVLNTVAEAVRLRFRRKTRRL
ncbi:ABC transporter permease subunit, partial [bacterium]|nr:ABC transporter permease subunit [bacterium]